MVKNIIMVYMLISLLGIGVVAPSMKGGGGGGGGSGQQETPLGTGLILMVLATPLHYTTTNYVCLTEFTNILRPFTVHLVQKEIFHC